MCNDFGNHIPYDAYLQAVSHIRVPVRVPTAAPNLEPRRTSGRPIPPPHQCRSPGIRRDSGGETIFCGAAARVRRIASSGGTTGGAGAADQSAGKDHRRRLQPMAARQFADAENDPLLLGAEEPGVGAEQSVPDR